MADMADTITLRVRLLSHRLCNCHTVPSSCVDDDTESSTLFFLQHAVTTLYLVKRSNLLSLCGFADITASEEHTLLSPSMQGGPHHARPRLMDKLVCRSTTLSVHDHCLADPGLSR